MGLDVSRTEGCVIAVWRQRRRDRCGFMDRGVGIALDFWAEERGLHWINGQRRGDYTGFMGRGEGIALDLWTEER